MTKQVKRSIVVHGLIAMSLTGAAWAPIAAAQTQAPATPTVEQLVEQLACRPGQECQAPSSAPPAAPASAAPAERKRGFNRSFFENAPPAQTRPTLAEPALPTEQARQQAEAQVAAGKLPSIDLEVPFAPESATPGPRARVALGVLGQALAHPRLAGYRFALVGHSDGVGNPTANQRLSDRRAAVAKAYLVNNFKIAAGRLDAYGRGQSQLKNTAQPGAPENRRVQVITQSLVGLAGAPVAKPAEAGSVAQAPVVAPAPKAADQVAKAAAGPGKLPNPATGEIAALNKRVEEIVALSKRIAELHGQGKFTEAVPLAERALRLIQALAPDHPSVGTFLNILAALYDNQGRYAEAEPLYIRSLALGEKARGPDHPEVGTALNNLAGLYKNQGRYAEAEPLYKRSLVLYEKALGPDHPDVGSSLNNLAVLYQSQGRYAEAEPLEKRSLALREKALGPDHPDVGSSLNNLAGLYLDQARYAEAEPLYKRSLALFEKTLGPDHPHVGTSLNNLANVYHIQGRYAEAEPLFKRSLAISEKALGPDHPLVGTALSNLAELYGIQGRYAEAEPLYKRSLTLREKALGREHPDVGRSLNNLASLYQDQVRYGEAEPLYKLSLALFEKALGSDHPNVGTSLNNLAALYLVQRDWARATDFWRRSAAVTVRRAQRSLASGGPQPSGKGKSEADQRGSLFYGLVKAVHRLAPAQRGNTAALTAETFATAQWAQGSEAAASLAQMAARGAAGNPSLATVVRERQDLVAEWQRRDEARTAAVSQPPAKRNSQAEAANTARLTEIDTRLAAIDKRLAAEFPDYAALASSQPSTIAQVQADLRPDEALVLFLDTPEWKPTLPEETFVWVVTKTAARWVRSDLGTPALTREVAALRCGLDDTAWSGDGAERCRGLLGLAPGFSPKQSSELPFDVGRSHKLYAALFGQVEDLIKDKQLLLVPSGPLTQLPFQVLVKRPDGTAPAGAGPNKSTAWLARDHALTVLPAVSSLRALRRVGKPSTAPLPMIGFGNPLLDGPDASYAKLAQSARARQQCPAVGVLRVAAVSTGTRGAVPGAMPLPQRAGLTDVTLLKAQSPLPETTDELCAVARSIEADVREMRLGAAATETQVKSLSGSGALAHYRIVHFATHGLLAGQLDARSEPGLILTPPSQASEEDDGYLSASEIAALKLDADWVILSACNTAASGANSAEALSGLARAFFYAQARALLVSHWEVDSEATVKLITTAVGTIARDPTVGRAEALRRAMLAMIDSTNPAEARLAHPAFWAPFIVVGEGGR